jgi:hypothetical protein
MKTSREYLGNQNVALPIESTTSKDTGYSSLQARKVNHYYKGFSITENLPKEVYEPPSYLELCDSFDLNQSTRVSTTYGKLAIDNAEYEDIEQKSISESSDDNKYTEGNSQYMPSNEICFDHAHDNRHLSDQNNIAYSHSVDNVYDSVYDIRNTADTYVNYTNS